MVKVLSVTVVGLALAAVGCQEQARPAQSPQAQAAPPPGGPHAPPPGMMPGHHPGGPPGPGGPGGPPGPWGPHDGGEGGPHHGGGGFHGGGPGEGLPPGHPWGGPHEGGPGHGGMGAGHGGMGAGHGRMGGGGDHEMMKELAALGVHFYAPPMLIRRAKDLNLTPDQVTKLRAEMLGMQGRAIDLHAKIEHSKVESARLLAADKPDEKLIGAQIDEAAKAQAELHKLHVGAMVRVRALLTPEQRQKLDEKKPHERPGAGHGPGPVGQADDDDDDDDA